MTPGPRPCLILYPLTFLLPARCLPRPGLPSPPAVPCGGFCSRWGSALSQLVADRLLAASKLETSDRPTMEGEEQKNAVDACGFPPWLAAWLTTGSDPCISSRAGLLSHLGPDTPLLGVGAVLCVVGCLAASLASTQEAPAVTFAPTASRISLWTVTTRNASRHRHMSPSGPPFANH